ncbi:MAG: hypothetical protein AAGA61_07745 [Pseudomonadota bacterium]
MFTPVIIGRILIALLVAAQLSAIHHAGEHGPGEHSHEGVVCVVGAVNDDTDAAALPFLATVHVWQSVADTPFLDSVLRSADSRRIPPATGPPA